MRLFRTRLHGYISLVLLACVVTAAIVVLLLPRERVTRANFEKIEIGMSVADVETLLGPPDFEWYDAIVPKPRTLDSGPHGREQDYEQSTGQGWNSAEITILVTADANGRIVRRDSADGRRRANAFEMVWAEIHWWIMRFFL